YSTYFNETVGKTVPNKYPSINNLSTDGRVITGSIRDNTTNGANMSTPFNYNIETGETNVAADHYSTGTYTTPDGGLVYGLNYERNTYDTFVWKNGVETDMYDWLLNGHGVDISEAAQQLLLQDISQDGRVVVGRNIDANGMSEVVIISL
ncbi:MAG: hypothetical protein LBV18_07045, partial [Alistipes sp.]|nr:hypothetical protein [Alistipes sp.]